LDDPDFGALSADMGDVTFGEAALLMFGACSEGETDGNNPFAAVVLPETSSLLLATVVICSTSSAEVLEEGKLLLALAVSFSMLMPAEKSLAPTLLLRLAVAFAVSFTELLCSPRPRTVGVPKEAFTGGGLGLARRGSRP